MSASRRSGFWRKVAFWDRAPSRPRKRSATRRPAQLERLEPRLLLSADALAPLAVTLGDDADDVRLLLDETDDLLRAIDAHTSAIVAEQRLDETSEVVISGGGGDDRFSLDASLPETLRVRLDGGEGRDTLHGPAVDTTWRVGGTDAGSLWATTFQDVERLEGAADNQDLFVFGTRGMLTGGVEGGDGGFDTIELGGWRYESLVFAPSGPDSGTISLDGLVTAYSGFEPINGPVSGDVIVLDLTDLTGATATLAPDTGMGKDPTRDFTLSADNTAEGGGFETHNFTFLSTGTSVTIHLGAGNDSLTLRDLAGTSLDGKLTITGGPGDDTFRLDDGWGVGVEIVENAGEGDDTLDFGDYSDPTGSERDAIAISPSLGGEVTISGGGSSLSLSSASAQSFEHLTQANVDLSGSAAAVERELVDGLESLVAFVRDLAGQAEFAKALPLVGGSAEVTLARALDFAEALDELRLEVEEFFESLPAGVTTDAIAAHLNGLFAGSPRVLEYLGAALLSANAVGDADIAASDVYEFQLELGTAPDSYTIEIAMSGAAVPVVTGQTVTVGAADATVAALVDAIEEALKALEIQLDVGVAERAGRIAFQAKGPDLERLSVAGLQEAASKLGFPGAGAVLDDVQQVLRGLGDLETGLAQGIAVTAGFANGAPTLRFDVDYEATRSTGFAYALPDEALGLGIAIDAEARIDALARLAFDFQLGLALADANEATFFLDVDSLAAGIEVDVDVTGLALDVGFASVTATGASSASLSAGVGVALASPLGISASDLAGTTGDVLAGVVFSLTGADGSGTPSFDLSLADLSIDAGLGTIAASGSLDFDGNPFSDPGTWSFGVTDFDPFQAFNNLNAAGVVSLLGELAGWLGGLADGQLLESLELPFVDGGLDRILDLAEVVRDALLFDEGGDDARDGAEKLVTDLNAALAAADLDGFLRAEGDGESLRFVAIDPAVTGFDLAASGDDDGGFAELALTAGSASADADGVIQLAGGVIQASAGALAADAGLRFTIRRNGQPIPDLEDVLLETDATTDNDGIGDDRAKLLDASNAPTFGTAQELAGRLAQILDLDGVAFDTATQRLTYEISFQDVPLFSTELATDFELDLSPVGSVRSDTRIVVDATGSLALVLGFDLSEDPGGSGKLSGDPDPATGTTLESLGVDVKLEEAVVADGAPNSFVGRLSGDAKLTLRIDGGAKAGTYQVTLDDAATTDNDVIGDLLSDLDTALQNARRTGDGAIVDLTSELDAAADGNQLKLVGIGAGVTGFNVKTTSGDPAFRDLGFQGTGADGENATRIDGSLVVRAGKSVPTIVGQLDADAVFDISFADGTPGGTVTVEKLATVDPGAPQYDNRNLLDLVSDVQTAVDRAIGAGVIDVAAEGGRLLFTRIDLGSPASGAGDAFTITPGSNAAQLGIGGTLTSDEADLLVFVDGQAQPHRVVLDGLETVGQVLAAIAAQTGGDVDASLTVDDPLGDPTPVDEADTGITLEDLTAAGSPSGAFMVDRVNGSLAAIQLGIVGVDANTMTDPEAQPDARIIGSTIAGPRLTDRFFVSAPDLDDDGSPDLDGIVSAGLNARAGVVLEEVAVSAYDGTADESTLVVAGFDFGNLDPDAVAAGDLSLEVKGVAGLTAGTYVIQSVVDDQTVVVAGEVGPVGRTGGVGLLLTGVQGSANFGFVGIDLNGSAGLGAQLSLGFDANAPVFADGILTLAELLDSLSSPLDLFAPPDLTLADPGSPELDLGISISAAGGDFDALAAGLLGGAPRLTVDLISAGDPFLGTRLEQAGYAKLSDGQFRVEGDLTGRLPDGVTLRVSPDAGDPFDLAVDATSFDGTHTTVDVSGDPLPGSLADVDVTLLPRLVVATSDLGDLTNFGSLGLAEILDALAALGDFLAQFESFGFLDDDLPIIDQSVNDLLAFAARFGSSIEDFAENPAGSLQALEDKLNEALGLSPDALAALFGDFLPGGGGGGTVLGLDPGAIDDVLDLSLVDGSILLFDLTLGTGFSEGLDFSIPGIEIPALTALGLDDLIDLSGGAGLEAVGSVALRLQLGVDVTDPGTLYLFDETGIEARLDVGAEDVAFRVSLGPLAASIASTDTVTSRVSLGLGAGVGLDDTFLAGSDRVLLSSVLGDLGGALDLQFEGSAEGELPVFFPNDSVGIGSIRIGETAGAGLGQLANLDSIFLQTDASPSPAPTADDFVIDVQQLVSAVSSFDFSKFDIFTNMILAVDGIDGVLQFFDDLIRDTLGAVPLPLIGDSLSGGVDFIDDLREGLLAPLREGIEAAKDLAEDFVDPDENIISELLYELLGPDGLGLLVPLGAETDSPGDFIDLQTNLDDYLFGTDPSVETTLSNVFMEWNLSLGSEPLRIANDISFDLGIPGLGLETDGDIILEAAWDLDLGFGVSFMDGFYLKVDDDHELIFNFDVFLLPATSITGTLGFLELRATDKPLDIEGVLRNTGLGATFIIDLFSDEAGATALDLSRVSVFEFGTLDFEAEVVADASATLGLELGLSDDLFEELFGDGAGSVIAGFPKVTSDFAFFWSLGTRGMGATLDEIADNSDPKAFGEISGSAIEEGLRLVEFRDVELDVGSFLSDVLGPIVEEVSRYTQPLQPIIDFITSPVPILGSLGLSVSWLDLAKALTPPERFNVGMIEAIAEIVTLINDISGISGGSIMLPVGDFTIFDATSGFTPSLWDSGAQGGLAQTFDDAMAEGLVSDLIGDAGGIGAALGQVGGDAMVLKDVADPAPGKEKRFSFPFLEDPTQIFGLLIGQPADLVAYDLPGLAFSFDFKQFFPVFGPLGVSIGLVVEFMADTAFVYDTKGIQDFVEGDFRNPLLLFNGFAISDSPALDGVDDAELRFFAELQAAAELNLGIASAGVAGALSFEILFDLFDPDGDGKIRFAEMLGNIENQLRSSEPFLAPLAIFDVTGAVLARLFAFLEINFGFFSIEKEFPIFGPVTLLDFEVDFFRPPILASEDSINGDLILNTGAFAAQRLLGNTDDVAERLVISSGAESGNSIEVIVQSLGNLGPDSRDVQRYEVARGATIVIDGGEGNDFFDLTDFDADGVRFEIDGGAGNDVIKLGAGMGVAGRFSRITGGTGDDEIHGSAGSDLIIGGAGNDVIFGGAGDDLIFGDQAELGTDTARGLVRASDGNDTIDGEAGEDILFGSGGSDMLMGGDFMGADLIVTGGGVVRFLPSDLTADPPVVVLKTFPNVVALEEGAVDDPENRAFDANAGDTAVGGWGNDILFGTAGPDHLIGGGDNDIIIGLGGFDHIEGLGGDDILFGDGGQLQDVGTPGTSDGASSSSTVLHDENASFQSDGIRAGDFARNETEGKFVRVLRVVSETELETAAVGDWSGDDYSFFVPTPTAGGEADEIEGGEGHDTIFGGDGGDLLQGGDGDDTIFGGEGADVVFGDLGLIDAFGVARTNGGLGNDRLFGQGEGDLLFGGAGNDRLDGGAGRDQLRGGDDTDVLVANKSSDFLDGEEDGDTYLLFFQGGNASTVVTVLDSGASGTDLFTTTGTIFDDQFLLRASPDGGSAFVAMIKDGEDALARSGASGASVVPDVDTVERIDYFGVERISMDGSFGDDHFASDDTAAEVTLNGGFGDDVFQIGQIFRTQRNGPATPTLGDLNPLNGISDEDAFATIATTRGFLSNGISAPMTINGGLGVDTFIVFHNRQVLQLNGDEGDDVFEVRAFALVGSQEPQRERTDISGGAGADLVQYAVNAPVNIDGGDGFDTLVVVGTEFADDFVVTESGVFGSGLTINFVNIESLRVDGAEGDDRFFVKSTGETFVTELFGGLGSDTFNMSGDTPPIVSNDLLGHSGIVLHGVESQDPLFDEQTLFGISANVADNDEPFAVIRPTDGSTIITEGGLLNDSYEIVLTRAPTTAVVIRVLAPLPTPDSRERRSLAFRVTSPTATVTEDNGTALELTFTEANWYQPQTVVVTADDLTLQDAAGVLTRPELLDPPSFDMNDEAFEGVRFGVINHLVTAGDVRIRAAVVSVDNDADAPHIVIPDTGQASADELVGQKLIIISGQGLGESRFVLGATDLGATLELELDRAYPEAAVPDAQSEFLLAIDDALVGTVSSNPGDVFTDLGADFPFEGEGLRGATLQIIGGQGAGQERLILGHVQGAEGTSLILNGPFSTPLVPGESLYRIERFAGLALPSVSVQINDDDEPYLIVDQTRGLLDADGALTLSDVVGDFDTLTALIEGGDGDQLGERDVLRIRPSTDPGATGVSVGLVYDASQLRVTDLSGALVDADNPLEFDTDDWDQFQLVVVEALDDGLREGFHSELIAFDIQSGAADSTTGRDLRFDVVPSDDPIFFVGLSETPVEGSVQVFLGGRPLAPAGEDGTGGDYILQSNKVLFVDDRGEPLETSGVIRVTYQAEVPGFGSSFTAPILARIWDANAPTVIVRESGGSTDVIELRRGGTLAESVPAARYDEIRAGNESPWNDSYELVLSGAPSASVTVTVTPDSTQTARTGGISNDAVQLELESDDSRVSEDGQGNLIVVFGTDDWDDPVEIRVRAFDDEVVDGGDLKVFAPGPNVLSGILGPVFVEGAGGEGSLGLRFPVMLPGETNVKPKTGDVVSVAGQLVRVSTDDLLQALIDLGLSQAPQPDDLALLEGLTLEITAVDDPQDLLHSAIAQFRLIQDVDHQGDETVLTLNDAYELNRGGNQGESEADIRSYALTQESPNFFVDETRQVDFMFVHDEDSPADSSGVLTPTRLYGLNMGPDLVIGDQRRPGGISYGDLEVLQIDLGTGGNELTVLGTHTRDDGYQTWTFLNTGDDIPYEFDGREIVGDHVIVKLDAEARITESGNLLAAGNPDPKLAVFDTTATIEGSYDEDALAGQLLRIVEDGQGGNGGQADGQVRRILGNDGSLLRLDRPWEFLPEGEAYEIVNPADGAFAVNVQGGDDVVDASASSLGIVAFGGLGDDVLMTGSGDDIVFGDRGRVDFFDEDGAIVTRLGFAPDPITGTLTEAVTPDALDQLVDAGAAFPVPDVGGDGVGGEDIGLRGLFVDVNDGPGFLQTPRLITGNDETSLQLASDLDPDVELPQVGSRYRISTLPEDQTDGVVREASLLLTVDSALGGRDTIESGAGADQLFGGADEDTLRAGEGADFVLGDGGRIDRTPQPPAAQALAFDATVGRVEVASRIERIRSIEFGVGATDVVLAGDGDDFVIGGGGDDLLDGDAGDDLIFGDQLIANRRAPDEVSSGRFQTLQGEMLYGRTDLPVELQGTGQLPASGDEAGEALVDGQARDYRSPDGSVPGWAEWQIENLFHSAAIAEGLVAGLVGVHGDDYIAGGADHDVIFGQLGDDTIQGDGGIESALEDELTGRVGGGRAPGGAFDLTPSLQVQAPGALAPPSFRASEEAATDGDDYIEGNGGSDVIFGNLGQDDLIGGSSSLFTLDAPDPMDARALRPDGADLIFGGSGQRRDPSHVVDASNADTIVLDELHARDSDAIAGDNANIYRVVGTNGSDTGFPRFDYDDPTLPGYSADRPIAVRAVELLDYTPGGPDFRPDLFDPNGPDPLPDLGAGDEIHGGSGDDFVYGMAGDDVLFGDSESDDLIGGWGNDWISGGSGRDGVLGDDGRIFTGRFEALGSAPDPSEPTDYAELLNGVLKVAETDQLIRTPGDIQRAIIHPAGELTKQVDLTPFNLRPNADGADDPLFVPTHANDIVYGGIGGDFLHGGSGDDAISGAEALPEFFARPVNPGDALRFDPDRIEFADYDEDTPRVRLDPFFLNFDASLPAEGDEDALFGDLGNDWLVGGPDNDHLFGGYGADLLDADDDKGTNGGANDQPDPPDVNIQDIAFGGAGRDVLNANTGGDRLIDWAGEFNSYLTPFAPFGLFTVSRGVPPHLFQFLYDLGAADGADPTRSADTGNEAARNGEPDGELGLVLQRDAGWQDQTGAPIDPQPGNIPGGARLTLRGVDFNAGAPQGFTPDSGQWAVTQGRFEVAPESLGEDAVSVMHVGEYLPSYFEVEATINGGKPTAGLKSNAYLIFDYQAPDDFKFAGVNISTDKMEIGYRDAGGWHVVGWTPAQLKPDQDYDLLLALNGLTATLVVDGQQVFSHAFAPRLDAQGHPRGLNAGMVGLGSNNSIARIDNVNVKVLFPEITFQHEDDFGDGVADLFDALSGSWVVESGRFEGSASGDEIGLSTFDLDVGPNSILTLDATLTSEGLGGFFFDAYGEQDYKFVAVMSGFDAVAIGHWSKGGIVVDNWGEIPFGVEAEMDLHVSLKGTTVSVSLDGYEVVGHVFNAVVVDGAFGLMTFAGDTSFDAFGVMTDDPAFFELPGESLLAASEAETLTGAVLSAGDLDGIVDEAILRWDRAIGLDASQRASLSAVRFEIAELDGALLGTASDAQVRLDADAAGHGWFVDTTPDRDEEFSETGLADPASGAAGAIDLLSVVVHELGHVLDLDPHAALSETLEAGTRLVPAGEADRDGGPAPAADPALAWAIQVLAAEQRRADEDDEDDEEADRDWVELPLGDAALL